MNLLESLNWRYATKRMNGEKVPSDKIETILEAARLAPTSSGLQPFNIMVISDPELLKKIRPIAHNQPQVTEASHLLVFAAWDNITGAQIDEVFNHMLSERGKPLDSVDEYKNRLKAHYASMTQEERYHAAARQAYIAFGVAITAAATERVDATPMEGFNPVQLDELLGLKERGLRSVTMLALGYRDTGNDWLAGQKKVRRSKKELIIEL